MAVQPLKETSRVLCCAGAACAARRTDRRTPQPHPAPGRWQLLRTRTVAGRPSWDHLDLRALGLGRSQAGPRRERSGTRVLGDARRPEE